MTSRIRRIGECWRRGSWKTRAWRGRNRLMLTRRIAGIHFSCVRTDWCDLRPCMAWQTPGLGKPQQLRWESSPYLDSSLEATLSNLIFFSCSGTTRDRLSEGLTVQPTAITDSGAIHGSGWRCLVTWDMRPTNSEAEITWQDSPRGWRGLKRLVVALIGTAKSLEENFHSKIQ